MGKRKLLPEVSPGKTVEGTIGLVAGSIAGCLLFRQLFFPLLSGCACRDPGAGGKRRRTARGSLRVGPEKGRRGEGFRHAAARSRGDSGPVGLSHVYYTICLLLSGVHHSMKRISLLGSTGSIGCSTLDVIGSYPDEFAVTALAAGRNIALLKNQIERFRPRLAAVIDEEHACELRRLLNASIGNGCSLRAGRISGSGGNLPVRIWSFPRWSERPALSPPWMRSRRERTIALANKETLVMAGSIVLRKAAEKGVQIIPVDSEHSAIFQCLQGHRREDVRRIILTASGGPFLHASRRKSWRRSRLPRPCGIPTGRWARRSRLIRRP